MPVSCEIIIYGKIFLNFSEFINEGVSNGTFGEKDEFNWIYTKFNLMALEVAPLLHEKLKQNKLKTMKKLI